MDTLKEAKKNNKWEKVEPPEKWVKPKKREYKLNHIKKGYKENVGKR